MTENNIITLFLGGAAIVFAIATDVFLNGELQAQTKWKVDEVLFEDDPGRPSRSKGRTHTSLCTNISHSYFFVVNIQYSMFTYCFRVDTYEQDILHNSNKQ